MSAIIADKSLSEDQRAEHMFKLGGAIGEALITIIRYHGEDKLKVSERLTAVHLGKSVILEQFMDVMSTLSFKPSANIDRSSVGAFLKSAPKELIWGPIARIGRDGLSQAVILELQDFVKRGYIQVPEKSPLRLATRDFWIEDILDKTINIRESRYPAQWVAVSIYVGIAFWGLLTPFVDVVGIFDGRSENSLFASSILYFSFWLTVASLKAASISKQTLSMLRDLKTLLNDPKSKVEGRDYEGGIIRKLKRFQNIRPSPVTCETKIGV